MKARPAPQRTVLTALLDTLPVPALRRWNDMRLSRRFIQLGIGIHGFRLSQAQLADLEHKMRALSLEEVKSFFPDDPWGTNFLVNVWEYAHGVTALSSYPWNVSLPVADVCNARCMFCTSWLEGRETLTLGQLGQFAPVLRNAIYVGLVGHGEPLAHPQFDVLCERLACLLDKRSTCYTITNGVFLEKWRNSLKSINLHSYSISLNAATPQTHHELMGLGLNAFDKILNSIEHLVGLRDREGLELHVYITLVVTRQNLPEIPAFIELGNRLGVTAIWLRTLLPQGGFLPGLNYHALPPYLHPDFASLVARARDAIAGSRVPVQAEPDSWSLPLFPPREEELIRVNPPPAISWEEAVRHPDIKQKRVDLYNMPPARGLSRTGEAPDGGDPLEDGLNPMNRHPRVLCRAVYYNLYINELFFKMNPCCYLYRIPGFEDIRFDGSYDFFAAWNSPAMVELRRRLNEGPLFGACKRCPEGRQA